MHDVKFGLFLPTGDAAAAIAAAKAAEAQGFFSVSINDHFFTPLGPPETPQLECFTILTAIAAVTERVKLAPTVAAMSFRTPPMLAKIASTLDQVSHGRLIMGLGAGWHGLEYHAHGIPFPSTPERLAQLEEGLGVLKAMWTEEKPVFRGRYFQVENAFNQPRPVQTPHPPIMLGGSGTGLLRIAAKHADILNLIPPTGNGKDFVNDPAATVAFDTARLKSRIAAFHTLLGEAGRERDEVELGGMLIAVLSRDANDPAPGAVATQLGFPDLDTAKRSPLVLLGSPNEAAEELRRRIADTGVTYHVVIPMSPDTHALFVDEVMPAFS